MGLDGSKRRFWRISTAGIFFQGGAAATDTSTIIAALVHGLTGSPFAVGAAAAIVRYGWLFPQIIVAYLAHRRERRMPFYMVGAFGRALCLALLAALVLTGSGLPKPILVSSFFAIWTAYAFVSGIVAVPYNDIVGRAIPSSRRSRMLAIRFFGGGLLALAVAGIAHELLSRLPFHSGYAAILFLGAAGLTVSAICFVSVTEPTVRLPREVAPKFTAFLADGLAVLREDRRFRLFLYVQWLAGVVSMSLPFYILQIAPDKPVVPFVGILLGAQTAGALSSNPLWGWVGDRHGKLDLLRLVSRLNAVAPAATLVWLWLDGSGSALTLLWFGAVFFVLGAVGNGRTIAYLGYLMEISPDNRRPAYSGYFNALVAPATLLPMVGALLATTASFAVVFAVSLAAALLQVVVLRLLSVTPEASHEPV